MDERLFENLISAWEETGAMNRVMAQALDENFEAFAKYTLQSIDRHTQNNQPDAALATMMRFSAIVSAAAALVPKIISKLGGWVNRLKSRLNALAPKIGADSFSISIDLSATPVITIGLNFPVTAGGSSSSTSAP